MAAMYPFVGDRERDAALARIAARHLRREDNRWSEAGADGDDPARDVLAYLRRHHTRLPRAVAGEDVRDELVLAAWVWWDERRRELELLHRARAHGHSLGEIGAFLGLATRQATYEHLDRLAALVDAHTADQDRQHRAATEHAAAHPAGRDPATVAGPVATAALLARDDLYRRTRGRRAAHVGADPAARRQRRRDARARPTREQWITDRHDRITASVSELLAQTARLGIDAAEGDEDDDLNVGDYLAALAGDLDQNDLSPATLAHLGLALGELRAHPAVLGVPPHHGVHLAIRAADVLRARYAALT